MMHITHANMQPFDAAAPSATIVRRGRLYRVALVLALAALVALGGMPAAHTSSAHTHQVVCGGVGLPC